MSLPHQDHSLASLAISLWLWLLPGGVQGMGRVRGCTNSHTEPCKYRESR